MTFSRFLARFSLTDETERRPVQPSVGPEFDKTISQLGGKTFEHGLYRVLNGDEITEVTDSVLYGFPEFSGMITVFGYDWSGRCFALNTGNRTSSRSQVLLFEPGSGEVLEIPVDIVRFHNEELVDHTNDALAQDFYHLWRKVDDTPIPRDSCVGYRVPLFLGGEDVVENLELTDLDVYLHVCGQLRRKIRSRPT